MEQLVKDLALLDLPSTMWGVHVHPENKFIGILHINVSSNKLIIDKGLLVEENDGLKARIILNGFSMYLPNVALGLKLISDISALLHTLHNKTVCINSNDGERYPECLKLIDNNNDVEEDITYCCMCRPANLEASAETLKFVYHELKPYNPNEETPGIDPNGLGEYKPTCSVYNQELSSEMDLTVHNEQYNKIKSEECPSKPKKGEKNNKEKQVLCNVCGKILAPGYRIEEHMLTHTLVKPFQCKICAKTFAKSHNLRMHEHTHSGTKPYRCNECGKTYTTSSNLRTHTISFHNEEKKHVCEICKMTFIYPRYLKVHMRKHTGERPYVCSACGKKFSKNIHLTIHMRTHTGEKPHRCNVCGRGFTTSGGLSYHRKAHHKDSNLL